MLSKYKIKYIVKIILGLIFCISAIMKLMSIDEFELYIFSFGLINFDLSSFAARCLIGFEFILGICLISNVYHKIIKWTTLITLILFSVFLIWRLYLSDNSNGHCFGDFINLNPKESLIKNVVFFILLFLTWNMPQKRVRFRNQIIIISSIITFSAIFIYSPPNLFYKSVDDTDTVKPELLVEAIEDSDLTSGKYIICFYSTGCKFCKRCASKISSIINRQNIDLSFFHIYFVGNNKEKINAFFKEYSDDLKIPYSTLAPNAFFPIINGSMPTIIFVDNGKLIKEYNYITINEKDIVNFLIEN